MHPPPESQTHHSECFTERFPVLLFVTLVPLETSLSVQL